MKPLHRYRVALSSWESWSLIVRAESAEAAEKEALTLWDTEGEEVFKHRGGGVLRMIFAFLCISPKESRFLGEFYSKKGLTFA